MKTFILTPMPKCTVAELIAALKNFAPDSEVELCPKHTETDPYRCYGFLAEDMHEGGTGKVIINF